MLVTSLLLLACADACSQDKKQFDQELSLPAVEKDVPYADGGDQQMLDLYLPDKKGFTTIGGKRGQRTF